MNRATKYCSKCDKEVSDPGTTDLSKYASFWRDDRCCVCGADLCLLAEVPPPTGDGRCSDDDCPCGTFGAEIPRGQGYLWIPKSFVDYRRDCLTTAEVKQKVERLAAHFQAQVTLQAGIAAPVLVCERGAKKRRLDMSIAAKDARRWWKTGLVPLRPTPISDHGSESREDVSSRAGFGSVPIIGTPSWDKWKESHRDEASTEPGTLSTRGGGRRGSRKWWQFWKQVTG